MPEEYKTGTSLGQVQKESKIQRILSKFNECNSMIEERIVMLDNLLNELSPFEEPKMDKSVEVPRDDVPSVLGALDAQVNRLHLLDKKLGLTVQHLKQIV